MNDASGIAYLNGEGILIYSCTSDLAPILSNRADLNKTSWNLRSRFDDGRPQVRRAARRADFGEIRAKAASAGGYSVAGRTAALTLIQPLAAIRIAGQRPNRPPSQAANVLCDLIDFTVA